MNYIKQKLYALFFWRTPIGEILSKFYDIHHHLKFSFNTKEVNDKEKLKHHITKEYHIIEKGLALPKPRAGFGQPKIKNILLKTNIYIHKYGESQLTSSVRSCLKEYLCFNAEESYILPPKLKQEINDFILNTNGLDGGGVKKVTRKKIIEKSSIDFEGFVRSRYSVRDFSSKSVDKEQIYSAITLAKYAPSVCNRQGWSAHVYSNKFMINELLQIQAGTGGFTSSIDKLIVITGSIKAFSKYESNQIFIDGGLFAMNLMFSLHNQGLGSCPLSTGFSYVVEKKTKKIAGISEDQRLIMMLAVGHLKEEFKVAVSERKETKEIAIMHQGSSSDK